MFETIYDNYVDNQSTLHNIKRKENKEEGWFSASSAGSCFKQQFYSLRDEIATDKPSKEAMRKMRLGTIMHKDFENAMIENKEKNLAGFSDSFKYFAEYPIKIPELRVQGTLDCAIYDAENSILTVGDLKTIGSYPYKLRFGREWFKNKSKISTNYELQLATYTIAMLKEIGDCLKVDMQLIFYNKDTSRIRTKPVDLFMRDDAEMYWQDLADFIDEEGEDIRHIKPNSCVNVPTQQWECNYCRFRSLCEKESE